MSVRSLPEDLFCKNIRRRCRFDVRNMSTRTLSETNVRRLKFGVMFVLHWPFGNFDDVAFGYVIASTQLHRHLWLMSFGFEPPIPMLYQVEKRVNKHRFRKWVRYHGAGWNPPKTSDVSSNPVFPQAHDVNSLVPILRYPFCTDD